MLKYENIKIMIDVWDLLKSKSIKNIRKMKIYSETYGNFCKVDVKVFHNIFLIRFHINDLSLKLNMN